MKKVLVSIWFAIATLGISSPSFASSEAETCINKIIQGELAELNFNGAKLLTSIQHEGYSYHWLTLTRNAERMNNVSTVISTDSKSFCKLVLFEGSGALPAKEDYYEFLGQEVTDKFIQAFRENR